MRSKANETEHLRSWAWCRRRRRQSDWETKIFSPVVCGEKYDWVSSAGQPRKGKSRNSAGVCARGFEACARKSVEGVRRVPTFNQLVRSGRKKPRDKTA